MAKKVSIIAALHRRLTQAAQQEKEQGRLHAAELDWAPQLAALLDAADKATYSLLEDRLGDAEWDLFSRLVSELSTEGPDLARGGVLVPVMVLVGARPEHVETLQRELTPEAVERAFRRGLGLSEAVHLYFDGRLYPSSALEAANPFDQRRYLRRQVQALFGEAEAQELVHEPHRHMATCMSHWASQLSIIHGLAWAPHAAPLKDLAPAATVQSDWPERPGARRLSNALQALLDGRSVAASLIPAPVSRTGAQALLHTELMVVVGSLLGGVRLGVLQHQHGEPEAVNVWVADDAQEVEARIEVLDQAGQPIATWDLHADPLWVDGPFLNTELWRVMKMAHLRSGFALRDELETQAMAEMQLEEPPAAPGPAAVRPPQAQPTGVLVNLAERRARRAK